MLAISSILVLSSRATAFRPSPPVGWYGTHRFTAFARVLLFLLIALAGATARYEGSIGRMTAAVLMLVLAAYELGETSKTQVAGSSIR